MIRVCNTKRKRIEKAMCVCVCVCVCVLACLCVCACVAKKESKTKRVSVCVRELARNEARDRTDERVRKGGTKRFMVQGVGCRV